MSAEDDLINEVGLLFMDAMSVRCEPSSYARRAISLVRGSPIPDEQIAKAIKIACFAQLTGASDGDTYVMCAPTRESMRAAINSCFEVQP